MPRARALMILLLLLILPMQGLAAALMPLQRMTNADTMAQMPCHQSADQGDALQSSAHTPGGTLDNTPANEPDGVNHQCCHQVFSAISDTMHSPGARKFSDVSHAVVPLYTLFIPDSPDRPPRG